MASSTILLATSAHSVPIENISIPGQTIFKGMLEYITWIKTKMTPSSEMSYHNDQKVPVEVADGGEGPRDLLDATWFQHVIRPIVKSNSIGISVRWRVAVKVHYPKKTFGRKTATIFGSLVFAATIRTGGTHVWAHGRILQTEL
ncbi:hypothetical protein IFR05_010325 [Cadophora sp. M221]|nr:hypothetical protein IFR05_010325 [Cadophora sp. M221]